MDINWYGQSCFKLKGKTTTVVIDPYDPEMLGLKLPKDLEAQILLNSHQHQDHNFNQIITGDPLLISGPGEYERLGVSITGIDSFHDNKKGEERGKNTIYQIILDNINIVHLGDLGHILTEEQTALIEDVDILLVPVGGKYTIDAETASKVVAELEPKIVIPMHYSIDGSKIELDKLELFLKEMGKESVEPISKLSVTKDKLPEEPQLVVLSKT